MNKKWLIGCSIAAFFGVVIVAGVVWGIYSFYSRMQSWRPEMPPELKEARIVVGSELFQKDIFIEAEKRTVISKVIGRFEDMEIGNLDGSPGTDIVIAGSDGAAVFDIEGKKQSQILYQFKKSGVNKLLSEGLPQSIGDVQIIDIENDGRCEYMGRGGIDGAVVFDHQGKQLWSYGPFSDAASLMFISQPECPYVTLVMVRNETYAFADLNKFISQKQTSIDQTGL